MAAQLEKAGDGDFVLRGELNVDSVTALWQESIERFRGLSRLSVDLAGVRRSDSSGVALLVEWLRQAKKTPSGSQVYPCTDPDAGHYSGCRIG